MTYIVNKTDGNIAAIVEDGSLNTDTSLKLVGSGYENYAETVAEDLVALLENFSSTSPPANPLDGQLWYNQTDKQLKVFNGISFSTVNNIAVSGTAPTGSTVGNFWYDTVRQQLFYKKDSTNWQVISPIYSKDQGRSEIAIETITDGNNNNHTAVVFYSSGIRSIIISSDTQYRTVPYVEGFSYISPGINLPYYPATKTGVFWGANGKAYVNDILTVGGEDGQIQFNSAGYFAGASGLTTNGINLRSAGTVSGQLITGITLESTGSGVIFPDNTVQTTAAVVPADNISGTGSRAQVAYFDTNQKLKGATDIITDGSNLTSSGTIISSNFYARGLGYVFPDNTRQTTAAIVPTDVVTGTATPGQLAYWKDANAVRGTDYITTNGQDIYATQGAVKAKTVILTAGGPGGITFPDGTVQTSASTTTNLNGYVTGSGTASYMTYWQSGTQLIAATRIYTDGASLNISGAGTIGSDNATINLGSGSIAWTISATTQQSNVIKTTNDSQSLSVGTKGSKAGTFVDTGKLYTSAGGIEFSDGTTQTTAYVKDLILYVTRSSDFNFNYNVWALVPWSNVVIDDASVFNNNANTRIVVPAGINRVRITAESFWTIANNGTRALKIQKNSAGDDTGGTNYLYWDGHVYSTSVHHVGPWINVTAGDYFEVFVIDSAINGYPGVPIAHNLRAGVWIQAEFRA